MFDKNRGQSVWKDLPAERTLNNNPSQDTATLPSFDKPKVRFKLPAWLKFKPTTKKEWVIGLSVIGVLLASGVFAGIYLYKKFSKPKPSSAPIVQSETQPPKPTTEASRLTGLQISPELNRRPVLGVMIENSADARPQAGLRDAGIVFEAIAEGGITRLLALFMEAQPEHIGPVRSVRPYYLDWLMPFDGAIVHAGGSAQALVDINELGIKDLNHNSSAFKRVSNRFAPHNLYTGFPALDEYAKSKGHTSSNFTSWLRKDEQPAVAPTAKSIDVTFSSFNFNVHYDWDSSTNSYKRAIAGKPHLDERSGAQLAPKVVLTLVLNRSQDGIYSVYQTAGSGTMYVFQDGTITRGTWSKEGRKGQYVFKDAAGQPLKLNPGQTWVCVIAADSQVLAKP